MLGISWIMLPYPPQAILANTPDQPTFQLHSLAQVVRGISYHVNVDKTEYMCFNREGAISSLNEGTLKLVDKFPYLGSSVSSTESDINMCQAKA